MLALHLQNMMQQLQVSQHWLCYHQFQQGAMQEAVAHLLAARSATADVPAPARAALLLAVPTDLHLGRLQRAGFSPFSPEMSQPLGLRMHAELLWRRATGRF